MISFKGDLIACVAVLCGSVLSTIEQPATCPEAFLNDEGLSYRRSRAIFGDMEV